MEYNTYPLSSISVEAAKQLQFKIIDCITRRFDGREILSLGDLGVTAGLGKPAYTKMAEAVFAEVFGAEAGILVRGSGTGAIRWSLMSAVKPGGRLLIHDAPVYPTTAVTIEGLCYTTVRADFNDDADIERVIARENGAIDGVLIQHTRQKIDDSYDLSAVIAKISALLPGCPIITDDNYAALKVKAIGCGAGADLASFSCFKILGPEGVGIVLGKKQYIDRISEWQYSGGSQVQGHEAMAALRGLVYAPVSLAIQSEVGDELVSRLNAGELPEVKRAFLANAQSKVVLVEFYSDCAEALLKITPVKGAAAHPVGSESIYEFVPMIYRVSGTFKAYDPSLTKRMIRINPMRSGADTVIRILKESLAEIK